MSYTQLFAAVCGNHHVYSDTLDQPGTPGERGVPKLCGACSAPIFTACSHCEAPILGYKSPDHVANLGRKRHAPWFCHECGQPYLWATPEQIRTWVENRLKFDATLDEDCQYELLDILALLTPGEGPAPRADFARFGELLRKAPAIYAEIKPFLPMLRDLFNLSSH